MGKKDKHHGGRHSGGHGDGGLGHFSGNMAAQSMHNTIGSGQYTMAHHDQINYGIPADLDSKFDKHNGGAGHGGNSHHSGGGSMGGGHSGGSYATSGLNQPLMAGQHGMGMGGAAQIKFHDKHLITNTRICGQVYKNSLLFQIKEVKRFFFIFQICFLSVWTVFNLMLWAFNPDTRLSPDAVINEACFNEWECNNHVHCWDNRYEESVVMAPIGFYPTESMALAQGQPWNADAAYYFDATEAMERWYCIGFFMCLFGLAKEITTFCMFHHKTKIFDVTHYNRMEHRSALKQMLDFVTFMLRFIWFIWGICLFWSGKTSGCRGNNTFNPNPTNGYLYLSATMFWIMLVSYMLRPIIVSAYLCCRHKKIHKKYDELAISYGIDPSHAQVNAYDQAHKKRKSHH